MGEQENMKKREAYQKNHLSLRAMFKFLSIIIFLFTTKVYADQNDPRLNNLFKKLNETESQKEISDLIKDIWNIWYQVDDPKVIEAFKFYQDLMFKHKITPQPGGKVGASNLFAAGKAAIMLDGTWQVGYMRSIKKDVNTKHTQQKLTTQPL